jgi:hypothetical protein
MTFLFFYILFSDAAYSNYVAPYMGTLEKVQSGLNYSQYYVGGMKQSTTHLSRHIDQT